MIQDGHRVGTTSILYLDKVEKGSKVSIKIDYSHSVLAFHTFTECPHFPIEISMISLDEMERIEEGRTAVVGDTKDSKNRLRALTS